MEFIPDESNKTVLFPIRVKGKQIVLADGNCLPALYEDRTGELILCASAVVDRSLVDRIHQVREIEVLPAGASVLLAVSLRDTPSLLLGCVHKYVEAATQGRMGFVEVVLKESLALRLRGTKRAELRPSACHIPVLNLKAISLNQAYTFISEKFEPRRASHTGNVFAGGRYFDGNVWLPLDSLRKQCEQDDITCRFAPQDVSLNSQTEMQIVEPTDGDTDAPKLSQSSDFLPRLRARYSRWIRQDLTEVRLLHRVGIVWLELMVKDPGGWNETVHRSNLAYLTDGDEPLFPPTRSAQENAERFLHVLDAYSFAHCTDLLTPAGAWEAAQSYKRPAEQQQPELW